MSKSEAKLELAARLKEARRLSGLSQAQVAKMMDWHRPTVSQVETAERSVSAEELQQLSKIFDVSISWLLEGASEFGMQEARLQLAARELQKLRPTDLDRLLLVIASMRRGGDEES